MKLLVIGATGRTGRLVLDDAVSRGDEAVAYARHPDALSARPGVTVLGGELGEPNKLAEAMRGVDAVVVTLGPPASVRGMRHVRLMQENLPRITAAMQATGVRRLVILSAFGVGGSADRANPLARFAFRTAMGSVYRDKVTAYKKIDRTAVDVTWVLPGRLTDGPDEADADVRPLEAVAKVSGFPAVPRATVARVLVDAAHDPQTIGEQLVVVGHGALR